MKYLRDQKSISDFIQGRADFLLDPEGPLFELNDQYTRNKVIELVGEGLKKDFPVLDFSIKCDEENNTFQTINNNELKLSVFLPTEKKEFLFTLGIGGKIHCQVNDYAI